MNLEFWASPNSEIMVTNLDTGFSRPLDCSHKCIDEIFSTLSVRYPKSFKHLCEKHKNGIVKKYKVVKNFIACNFANNDNEPDLSDDGSLTLENISCPGKCLNCCPDKGIVCNPSQAFFTNREKQVLELIKRGETTKKISKQLNISIDTVKTHKRNMYAKTGIHSAVKLLLL